MPLTAQSIQTDFAWFGELVSVNRPAGTVTVRAAVLPQVARYIDTFEPGNPIVAVWTQFDGEADAVLYVERPEVMTTTGGYIVHAELVSCRPGCPHHHVHRSRGDSDDPDAGVR